MRARSVDAAATASRFIDLHGLKLERSSFVLGRFCVARSTSSQYPPFDQLPQSLIETIRHRNNSAGGLQLGKSRALGFLVVCFARTSTIARALAYGRRRRLAAGSNLQNEGRGLCLAHPRQMLRPQR